MKLKTTLTGAMLLLAATTTHALDMRGVQPDAAASEARVNTPTSSQITITDAQLRVIVARTGLDPDSEKGRLLMRFAKRVVTDPGFLDRMKAHLGDNGFFDLRMSPSERIKVLQLMKGMGASKDDCKVMDASSGDFFAMARTMTPEGFRSVLELIEISAADRKSDTTENYSIVDLLDIDAQLESTEIFSNARSKRVPNSCELLGMLASSIDALPASSQTRATYEMFRLLSDKGSARDIVLSDPMAYLDEAFDERKMPDAVRQKLPSEGSHTLPYAKLVIDAEWQNEKTGKTTAFRDTYINRRNNGVVADLTVLTGNTDGRRYADFNMGYGITSLRTQTVALNELSPLGTLQDVKAIDTGSQPLLEGRNLKFSVPLPSQDGQLTSRCTIGKTRPASTIFRTLEGDAVDIHCEEVTKGGSTQRYDEVWLVKYEITWRTATDHDDGRTLVVVKDVAVEQP